MGAASEYEYEYMADFVPDDEFAEMLRSADSEFAGGRVGIISSACQWMLWGEG